MAIDSEKKVSEFYQKISVILKRNNIDLYNEFNAIKIEKEKKEIYLWLNKKKEEKILPNEIIKIMPDLFGWIM
jgi:hypothetical protein